MLLIISPYPVSLDSITLSWRTIKSNFWTPPSFPWITCSACCTSAPAGTSQGGSDRVNCFANMCFCYLACHPLNHHEFSKRGKCNPLLWKNVITVTAVNGSSNCVISLQKESSLPQKHETSWCCCPARCQTAIRWQQWLLMTCQHSLATVQQFKMTALLHKVQQRVHYSTKKQSISPLLPHFWVPSSHWVVLHGCKHPLTMYEHCPLFYASLETRSKSNPGNTTRSSTNSLLRRWANTRSRKPPLDSCAVPFFFLVYSQAEGSVSSPRAGGGVVGPGWPPAATCWPRARPGEGTERGGAAPALRGSTHRVPSGRKRASPLPMCKPAAA